MTDWPDERLAQHYQNETCACPFCAQTYGVMLPQIAPTISADELAALLDAIRRTAVPGRHQERGSAPR